MAYAHAKVLSLPEAGGQKFILSDGPFCLQGPFTLLSTTTNSLRPGFFAYPLPFFLPSFRPLLSTCPEFTDALYSLNPSSTIPKGQPGATVDLSTARIFTGKKAEKVLGVKYRSIKETVKGMEESIRAKGFL